VIRLFTPAIAGDFWIHASCTRSRQTKDFPDFPDFHILTDHQLVHLTQHLLAWPHKRQ